MTACYKLVPAYPGCEHTFNIEVPTTGESTVTAKIEYDHKKGRWGFVYSDLDIDFIAEHGYVKWHTIKRAKWNSAVDAAAAFATLVHERRTG